MNEELHNGDEAGQSEADVCKNRVPGESRGAGARRGRCRRIATSVSDVDQHLIDKGLAPSWEDRVTDADIRPGSMRDSPGRGDGANDRRLMENVPPHAQARA